MSHIPEKAFTRHTAILGTTGSGKTSVAKAAIVEPILDAKGRVVILDPTGAWWGLRLMADGKRPGYPIHIFGGDHGDLPLQVRDAEVLAGAFGTSSDSAIFDTSIMTVTDRTKFFTDFVNALMRKNKGRLNVIIDEAHLFMPQAGSKVGGAVPAMLHAGNNLVSGGRLRGLRVTMLSQRPQKLHKDSLTQAQTLIALRVMHPLDRRAIEDWIGEVADPQKAKQVMSGLAEFKTGQAWVWSPLDSYLEQVQFNMPWTFDSSKEPDQMSDGPILQPLDIGALKDRLTTITAEAKANDPKALKAEIAKLRNEAIQAQKLRKAPVPEIDVQAVQKKAWGDGHTAGSLESYAEGYKKGHRDGLLDLWSMAREKISQTLAEIETNIQRVEPEPKLPAKKPLATGIGAQEGPIAGTMTHCHNLPEIKLSQRELPTTSQAAISPSGRKIIDTIHKAYPISLSFEAAAHRAGVSKRSSAYRIYRNEVRESSELEVAGSGFRSKPEFAATEQLDPQATIQQWVSRLPPSFGKMLQAIADGHTTKQEIAHASGVSPTSSGLNSGFRELLGLDLIYNIDGGFYLSEGLSA